MTTIKDVAELANVSQATVSRALNGHASVREENRDRVFAAIKALGYQPNTFAQALASNRSHSIGMLVGSLSGPYFGPIMHQVERELRSAGYHLILSSGQEDYEEETESIQFLLSRKIDGLILLSDTLSDIELIDIAKSQIPVIVIGRYIPEIANQCVWFDNEQGGYLATEHLIKQGHKAIGCVTGQLSKSDSRDRLQGYRNALLAHGLEYARNNIIEGRFDNKNNYQAILRLLERQPNLSALFCMNDDIAMSAYSVCNDLGLDVGKDISLVGFDNVSYGQYLSPALSTIDFPINTMASMATQKMLQMINNENLIETSAPMSPSVIARGSVSPYPHA